MAAPKARFMLLGKSKFVHVVYTKAYDLKHSECQMVRKMQVTDSIKPKDKGLSPEAAMALDPCSHCEPGALIKAMETPESKRAKSKARTQDTLDRVADARKPKAKIKAKQQKTTAVAKKMVKSGPKSLGNDQEKAAILAEFAGEHGWSSLITKDKPGVKLVTKRGDETITCWFDGGRYDISRLGYIEVKGSEWQGKLRAAHACRRQMSGEGRDRPHPSPGAGRSAPRGKREEPTPETESPEDAKARVPFLQDDDDLTIIDAIKGKVVRWRNGVSGEIEEATMPAEAKGKKRDKITMSRHPKTGRRIIDFFEVVGFDSDRMKEVYGPERAVGLDKIIRVL